MNEEYLELQLNGSAWTRDYPGYQGLLKEGIDWMLETVGKPKTLLDLGCGDGWGTQYIQENMLYTKVVGGDIDRNKLKVAEQYAKVMYQDMHYVEGKWDVIFCAHSLEHSYDLKKAIASILDALNDKLYLIVPIESEYPEYNPSHTQWIDDPEKIKKELEGKAEVIYEAVKLRGVPEYWLICQKLHQK